VTADGLRPPSIQFRDVGDTACREVFRSNVPSQNAVVFRDDVWPAARLSDGVVQDSLQLALTTTSSDVPTGELRGWTMEINTAQHSFQLDGGARSSSSSLEEVILHELGHVLGLAHSKPGTVMYALYGGGRQLAPDDVEGICSVYPPDGSRRAESPQGAASVTAARGCEPLPAQGFSRECAANDEASCVCAVRRGGGAHAFAMASSLSYALIVLALLMRRWRRPGATAGSDHRVDRERSA